MIITDFSGSASCAWLLTFRSHDTGEILGLASWKIINKHGVLKIDLDGYHVEAHAVTGDFLRGDGIIELDNKQIARFIVSHPADFRVKFVDSEHDIYSRTDNWKRRFRWACKHGASWKHSWGYAIWGELVISNNFILSSPLDITNSLWLNEHGPLLSTSDAKVLESRPIEEQIAVLVLLLRGKCGT